MEIKGRIEFLLLKILMVKYVYDLKIVGGLGGGRKDYSVGLCKVKGINRREEV